MTKLIFSMCSIKKLQANSSHYTEPKLPWQTLCVSDDWNCPCQLNITWIIL